MSVSKFGVIAIASLGLLCASATGALAGEWDARGKLSIEGADYAFGFDAQPGAEDLTLIPFGPRGGTSFPADSWVADDEGLEGAGHLSMGGHATQVIMTPGSNFDQFRGRRVEVSLWYLPDGTDASVSMSWVSGDVEGYLRGTSRDAVVVGTLNFYPTGRATSDGWIEVSSGAFDYENAGIAPAWITVRDTQQIQSYYRVPLDSEARVAIDALEVVDLGAADAPAACSGWTEEEACGSARSCLFGQCVDDAIVTGGAPQGQIRQDYLRRLGREIDFFEGVRQGRARIGEVTMRLEALAQSNSREFWRGLTLAHELLIDGHGAAPSATRIGVSHPSGICLGPGAADLLPGAADGASAPVPMVFSTNSDFPVSDALQQGDVLTRIDGVSVSEWTERMRHALYYNGDVRGREAMLTRDLVRVAKQYGSRLTFERCDTPDAACSPEQIQEVELDFARILGDAIWSNSPPLDFYDYSDECDLRFERPVDIPPNTYAYYFSGYHDIDGIRHLLINGVPELQSQQGDRWRRNVESALNQVNTPLILDQRTGFGGTIESLAFIVGYFLAPSNKATSVFFPWVGEEITGDLLRAFDTCTQFAGNSGQSCGLYYSVTPTDYYQTATASQMRLAVLNGYDVSGNDYLPRFLQFRQAETRQFGYGPTIGAFGQSCALPSHLPNVRGMAYQCHDSIFRATRDGADEGFESGYGVMADEVHYQKQSDALRGVDTLLEAARAWASAP